MLYEVITYLSIYHLHYLLSQLLILFYFLNRITSYNVCYTKLLREIAVWIDGAMPFRAETILGYIKGMHNNYVSVDHDYSAVTRTEQKNDTQNWKLIFVGTIFTIQQNVITSYSIHYTKLYDSKNKKEFLKILLKCVLRVCLLSQY